MTGNPSSTKFASGIGVFLSAGSLFVTFSGYVDLLLGAILITIAIIALSGGMALEDR